MTTPPTARLAKISQPSRATKDKLVFIPGREKTGAIISQHKLFATSGSRCLSPGGSLLLPGPNPTVENDDLSITFPGYSGAGVHAIGFDILFQSLDGAPSIHIHHQSNPQYPAPT